LLHRIHEIMKIHLGKTRLLGNNKENAFCLTWIYLCFKVECTSR